MSLPVRSAAAAALLLACGAQAQIVPNAGSTLRDVEKPTLELPRKPPPGPSIEEPARPALKPAPAVRFSPSAFRITGNIAIAEAELQPLFVDLIGREIGFAELEEAAARITRLYRERGYSVARAYLPSQDIRAGVVEIAVLEGRFGKIALHNRSRLRDGVAGAYLEPLQGHVIGEHSFERKLLLLYDLPGTAQPSANLRPGALVGESDLAVELDRGPFASGSLELDNYGSRFTGANRLSGQANLLNPTGLGDLFSLRFTHGDPGLDYLRAAYQLPVGADGWKLGASYAQTDYRLGKQFSVLEANGEARAWNTFASYPLIRGRNANLSAQAAFEKRDMTDRIDAAGTVTDKTAEIATLSLLGDSRDGFGGGGINVVALSFGGGDLAIRSPLAGAIDAASARSAGSYSKWNLSLLRLQTLTERLSLYASWTAQQASKNLDSSEKFVLGGATGVRAYPSGEAAGDSGSLLNIELRYSLEIAGLPGALQPFLFVDTGEVTVNENPFVPGDNKRRLSAGGLGFTWLKSGDFSVKLVYAHKIGNARALSDTDSDARAWLQLIKYF